MSKNLNNLPALLLLEDGTVFQGIAIGKIGTATGEICFNTGMSGYQEVFTDPSYYGQILVETNAHIGNYGIANKESESGGIKIAGLVCRNFNIGFTRQMANQSIQDYFSENNLTGIGNVDTRSLVLYIRNKGAMNAIISSEELDISRLKAKLNAVPSMAGLELSSKVTTQKPYFVGNPSSAKKVALMDFGVKQNIIESLLQRDCYVGVFPAHTKLADMKEWNPSGYQLSNGPGDPSAMPYAVETVNSILGENKPVFGICLGHQILSEAVGLKTYKMHNGHRGCNHPVKNLETGKCEVTSQNHGFAVNADEVEAHSEVTVTHVNLNDNTIEGIRLKNRPAFSVQYHPEASPGPHDSRYLFDNFVNML